MSEYTADEMATMLKAWRAPDAPAKAKSELAPARLLADVLRYRRGLGRYDFSRLPDEERSMAALEAWEALETKIERTLSEAGVKVR